MRDRLQQETKRALKAQDKARLGALRLISAALKDREIAQRTDTLSDQEAREIAVIEEFLPAQMGEAEVKAAIAGIIAEVGASGPKDMGKVMGLVKPKVAGRTDMGKLSELVKARLANPV